LLLATLGNELSAQDNWHIETLRPPSPEGGIFRPFSLTADTSYRAMRVRLVRWNLDSKES
jgi:hypothetical protein